MSVRAIHGDMLEVIPQLVAEGVVCDAVCTDPPYHLTGLHARAANATATGPLSAAHRRLAAGFMGQQWDGGDIAFHAETWSAIGSALKPGGFLLAFGGTRTWHRMACAIEDAGFEIRDTIAWIYGSGMPKSLNVSKAIDKAAGAQRKVVGTGPTVRRIRPGADQHRDGSWEKLTDRTYTHQTTEPATEEARQWQGWGTGLKPAFEPIIVARKPLIGTVVENVLRHGTGAINIDGCRIVGPKGDGVWGSSNATVNRERMFNDSPEMGEYRSQAVEAGDGKVGRWPANLCHDGSDEVVALFPAKAGACAPASGPTLRDGNTSVARGKFNGLPADRDPAFHGDTGSAARFFFSSKAGKEDRWGSRHPTVKPVELMKWLVQLVTPPNGTTLDPFAGSGTTGVAALATGRNAILIEREEQYCNDIKTRLAFYGGGGLHSTQAKTRHRKVELGPLFAEPGE